MIHICPVCRRLYEAASDCHFEPCADCWRKGWRCDSFGNVFSIGTIEQRIGIAVRPEVKHVNE